MRAAEGRVFVTYGFPRIAIDSFKLLYPQEGAWLVWARDLAQVCRLIERRQTRLVIARSPLSDVDRVVLEDRVEQRLIQLYKVSFDDSFNLQLRSILEGPRRS